MRTRIVGLRLRWDKKGDRRYEAWIVTGGVSKPVHGQVHGKGALADALRADCKRVETEVLGKPLE